jgi:hypothetical protein
MIPGHSQVHSYHPDDVEVWYGWIGISSAIFSFTE